MLPMDLTDIGVLWTQQGAHIIKVHQQKCYSLILIKLNLVLTMVLDNLDLNLVSISYQMDLN